MSRPGAACVLALAVFATTAKGESTVLCVTAPLCTAQPVDREAFLAALRVELGESGIEVATGEPAGSLLALGMEAVPCASTASSVELVVSNGAIAPLTRLVSLSDVPASMRARTVALASAELVTLSRRSPAAAEMPAPAVTVAPARVVPVPVTPPAPTNAAVFAEPGPPPQLFTSPLRRGLPERVHPILGIAGEYRRYPDARTNLYGARAVSESALPLENVVLRVDASGVFGTQASSLGDVSLQAFAAAAGGEWLTAGNDVAFALGALAEGGYAHAKGTAKPAVTGTSASSGTFAVMAVASVRFRVVERFWAALELSAGIELAGLRAHADDAVAGGIEGPSLGARLVAAYGR